MAQYVYSLNRVGKIVPPKRQILKDISLSFFPGAKIGLLGLNGSGKSSLIRIMAGVFRLLAAPHPGTLHDYHGFPPHTYRVRYPAPGVPEIAVRARSLLQAAGLAVAVETERGFDHGVFVPLGVMYPQADIPVLALSLKHGLDPAEHLTAGRALAPLRSEGVLILGSGFSYHNMAGVDAHAVAASRDFDAWLQETLVGCTGAARAQRLCRWADAPSARYAPPHEEHLLPLMVAAGAGSDDAGACVFHQEDMFGGITISSFRFGASPAA